jgi:multiple sugar transport system substrate-binding protein
MSAFVTAGLMVGCTPGDSPGGDGTSAEGFSGTLELWDWDHEPRVELLERLVGEWEEQNDGSINYRPLEWTEIETRILTAAAGGTGPALSNMHYFWRPSAQKGGALTPYPDDVFNFDDLISTPFIRDPETGNVYTSVFNHYCNQLYYHRDILEEEGISEDELPGNWDDLVAMAQQLTRTNGDGTLERAGFTLNNYWAREWLWHDLVYQQGGWLYNESGTEALWNSDEGVEALKFIQDVYHTWNLDDPDGLEQNVAFGNGRAAMFTDFGYTSGSILFEFSEMEDRFATAVEPTFSGSPSPSWGMQMPEEGFVVFDRFSDEEKAAAFDFIRFAVGSPERRVEWSLLMKGPPDDRTLLDHPAITENNVIRTQAETLPYRIAVGERPLEAERIWRNMFDRAVLEQADPQEIMDEATAEMNRRLASTDEPPFITERSYTEPSA